MVYSTQARHSSAAQSVSLEFTHGTYGLVVWYKLFSQALSVITRSRIARHCYAAPCGEYPVCVAVRKQLERLRSRNGRTLCAPTVEKLLCRSPYFEAVTCRQSAPDSPREKGRFTRGWKTAVFQKQFPFNYTKSSKVEQKYSISPLKCLQSVILKSEVSIMQCKGSTKSTVSGRFKIIVAEISGVICGVKIQVAAAANMK